MQEKGDSMKLNNETLKRPSAEFNRKIQEDKVHRNFDKILLNSLKTDSFAQIKSAEKLFDFFSSLKVSLVGYMDDERTLDNKSDLSHILNEYLNKAQKVGFGCDPVQDRSIKEEKVEETRGKTDEKKKNSKSENNEKDRSVKITQDIDIEESDGMRRIKQKSQDISFDLFEKDNSDTESDINEISVKTGGEMTKPNKVRC